jgi:hypothetical protein
MRTFSLAFALAFAGTATAGDWPTWGGRPDRNMVSAEKNLCETFNPATGENVKWAARLGGATWGSPVVAAGRVLTGYNGSARLNRSLKGERGIL